MTLAKLHGFKGLFVLQPIIGIDNKTYTPRERRWIDMDVAEGKIFRRRKFYELARPFFVSLSAAHPNQKTLCFADLSGVLSDVEDRVYVDEGHLNSKGNQIMAQTIIDQLAKCGFMKLPEKS
jgi:lysophospholipase L1-like esterase